MEIKKYNLNYILILILYLLLNIILLIVTFNNFNYIFTICELLIVNKIFYILLITIILLILSLFYIVIVNFNDKKVLNSGLIIITILIVIFFILSIYLRLKVDMSKSSEILYNSFLEVKLIKVIWRQEELMAIYKYHSFEKGYILSEEKILSIISEIKNPEELIQKLNAVYLEMLNVGSGLEKFIYDHKYKMLLGTGIILIGVFAGVYYLGPALFAKVTVVPVITEVEEYVTPGIMSALTEDKQKAIITCCEDIAGLHKDINYVTENMAKLTFIFKHYIIASHKLHHNIFTKTTCQITSRETAVVVQSSLESLAEELANIEVLKEKLMLVVSNFL